MKNIRTISLLLALAMLFTVVLASCDSKTEKAPESRHKTQITAKNFFIFLFPLFYQDYN